MKIKIMFAGLLFCASLQGMEGEPDLEVQHRHLDIKNALVKLDSLNKGNVFRNEGNTLLVINYVPVDRAVKSDAALRAIIMHDMVNVQQLPGLQDNTMKFRALLVTDNTTLTINGAHPDDICRWWVYNFSEKISYDAITLNNQFETIQRLSTNMHGVLVNIYGEVSSIQKHLKKHFPGGEGKDYISMNKPGVSRFIKVIGGIFVITFFTYLLFRLCR